MAGTTVHEGLVMMALAVDLDGQVPEWIQVLPLGEVVSDHGRFIVDQEAIEAIMAHFAHKGIDVVIDYEHQTLDDVVAPAGGWIKEYQVRNDGLYGRVEWTSKAREHIRNKEYRYISPVVMVRKDDKRAVSIHSVGLTNAPAIHGMRPLINKSIEKEEKAMELLQQIRELLGLPEDADQAAVLEAIRNLKQAAGDVVAHKDVLSALGVAKDATKDQVLAAVADLKDTGRLVAHKEILELLEVPETADLNAAKGKILALKNPSGYVRVEEFNALKSKLEKRDADELVEMALKQGKIAPAQKAWAEQYALKDPAGFKAFVEQAPEVVPISQREGYTPRAGADLDEAQMMVNKQLGLSDEAFKKYGGDR